MASLIILQSKYLAQIYNIAPDYAMGVYDQLPEQKFSFDEIKEKAKDAHTWYKEMKLQPSMGEKLVGHVPSMQVYNA